MRILIGIGHPKQVHFWRNIINNLVKDGHEVRIAAWDKDLTLYLLNAYGFKYDIIGQNYKGLIKKAYGLFASDIKLLKIIQEFKPDLLLSGVPYLAHLSKLVGKPHVGFTDTEHAALTNWLSFPFSDIICTPSCYKGKINPKKHITYNGYEELAYLHPDYFKPDPSVLDELELSKDDEFIILRFVSWNASHDIRQRGINLEMKRKYNAILEQYGRVFISSESKIEEEFEKYKLKISPEKLHSLLSYAHICMGESGAMATEAGIIGTPSVYISSLVGTMGNFDELEKKYGLVYSFNNSEEALTKLLELLEDRNIKNKWQSKREKLLHEKIDVTKFMTKFIENYPI